MSLPARLLVGLMTLLLAAAAGWRQGVRSTLAAWRAADLASERAGAELARENQRLAGSAAARYEAQRAARERDHANTITSLRRALAEPIQCVAGGAARDVLVPAAAVGELRAAGADQPGGADPATGRLGR